MQKQVYALRDSDDDEIFVLGSKEEILEYLWNRYYSNEVNGEYKIRDSKMGSVDYAKYVLCQAMKPHSSQIFKETPKSHNSPYKSLLHRIIDYPGGETKLQNPGDLEELIDLVENHPYEMVDTLVKFIEFLECAYNMGQKPEPALFTLQIPNEIKTKFPKLTQTILIWVWG